jgi:sortase (surface protein transpeptidase)
MAGHIDYWDVGPSVFYNLGSVQTGAEIIVTGDDGLQYPFTVDWTELFTSDDMPMDEITGPTDTQSLTLITCGGAFDYVNGEYLQRTVVRATRSGPGIPVT